MEELHKHKDNIDEIVPNEGQQELLCKKEETLFEYQPLNLNDQTIDIFSNFAVTLKRIHTRLLMEGWVIKDGKIIKPNQALT